MGSPQNTLEGAMDAREAVRTARHYVSELFADDEIGRVDLEEVDFENESDVWKITVSFTRPNDRPELVEAIIPGHPLADATPVRRSYKVVNIDDASGSVTSLKHRRLTALS